MESQDLLIHLIRDHGGCSLLLGIARLLVLLEAMSKVE